MLYIVEACVAEYVASSLNLILFQFVEGAVFILLQRL